MDLVTARHRYARKRRQSGVRPDSFALAGGLNLVDTSLSVRPGQLLACKNYEPRANGRGYQRTKGFERYDSETPPSRARYTILQYERATLLPDPWQGLEDSGDIIEGESSGARGVVIGIQEETPITVINLLLRSQEIDNGVWAHDEVTIGATDIDNPINGSPNAEWIAETTDDSEHGVIQSVTKDSQQRYYWLSAYVRGHGGTSGAAIRAFFSSSQAQVIFDFSTLSAAAVTDSGDFVGIEEYMEQLAGGYWRIGVKFRSGVQTSLSAKILCAAPGGILSYSGDPSRGLDVFGVQLEETDEESIAPGAYVETDGFPRGNGAGYYALIHPLGILGSGFTDGERIQVLGVDYSQADGSQEEAAAEDEELHRQFEIFATFAQRGFISSVPGSGPIRGVAVYRGLGYALRDNAAGTAGVFYKHLSGGWVAVNLGRKLFFSDGQAAGIDEGDLVIGQGSGAQGTVRRVVVLAGSFETNDAAGFLIFQTISGTFAAMDGLMVNSTNRATAISADTAQTLNPGGRLETRVHNFFGHTSTTRLYGVDGQNFAFEYQDNPEFFCQIETGMVDDRPVHLGIHQEQLWLAFRGGSLQKSSVGDAAVWSVTLGAAELAVGDEITGLLEEIGDVLFVFTRGRTRFVLGDVTNYALKNFSPNTGAIEWTVQRIGKGIYLDDRGFTSLAATQRFGNYAANSFSADAKPLVDELREVGVTASCVVKNKNLVRFFFADGRFLSIGVAGEKITGITSGDLGAVVRCVDSAEDAEGRELIIFGSDDGYVYQMESGKSFDGQPIQSFLRSAFHFSGSPNTVKKYRRAQFHIDTQGPCTLRLGADYSFADPNAATEHIREIATNGGGGIWDVSVWDEFAWSAAVVASAAIKLDASGTNIGFLVSHESSTEEDHAVTGILLDLSPRRLHRGTNG